MKEIKHYICDICHTTYNEKQKAVDCEKAHKKPIGFAECTYKPIPMENKGYPYKIMVSMSDGTMVRYIRGQEQKE